MLLTGISNDCLFSSVQDAMSFRVSMGEQSCMLIQLSMKQRSLGKGKYSSLYLQLLLLSRLILVCLVTLQCFFLLL
jgi:hypothetical protein